MFTMVVLTAMGILFAAETDESKTQASAATKYAIQRMPTAVADRMDAFRKFHESTRSRVSSDADVAALKPGRSVLNVIVSASPHAGGVSEDGYIALSRLPTRSLMLQRDAGLTPKAVAAIAAMPSLTRVDWSGPTDEQLSVLAESQDISSLTVHGHGSTTLDGVLWLAQMRNLQSLSVSGVEIKRGDVWKFLAFQKCPKLRDISFHGTDLGPEDQATLSETLPLVEHIVIFSNGGVIDGMGWRPIGGPGMLPPPPPARPNRDKPTPAKPNTIN